MNHDTPDAVPSDDLPFLGPAISPRRSVSGSPLSDSDELAAPFVGGAYDSLAQEATPTADAPAGEAPAEAQPEGAPWSAADVGEEVWPREEEGAAEAGALDPFPGSDWPSDDFPWLSPTAPEPEENGESEAWQPALDTDELTPPAREYSVDMEASVQHLSWIGEPISQGEIDAAEAAAAAESQAELEEVLDVSSFAAEAEEAVDGERMGFRIDAESAEGSWTTEVAWEREEVDVSGEEWGGEVVADEAAMAGAEAPAGGEQGADLSGAGLSAEAFTWDEAAVASSGAPPGAGETGAEVGDEEVVVPDAGLEGEEEAALFGDAVEGAPEREAVEAAALPLSEWEAGAAAGEVEEEALESTTLEAESVSTPAPGDPMEEVAERLERIAGALRSGRPLDAVEQGDPLQLLITGYALGYAQARRAGR